MRRTTLAITFLTAGALAAAPVGTAAFAASTTPTSTVVATGLEGPRQLFFHGSTAYVATSDDGQVRILTADGKSKAILSRLGPAQGVAVIGRHVVTAVGSVEPDAGGPMPPAGRYANVVKLTGGKRSVVTDLQTYELKANPDGQQQFDAKKRPLDALSNPYFILPDPTGYAIVADAGANDILRVSSKGVVTTLAALPNIRVGACAAAKNNDAKHPGCDPVPTGLAWGPDGALYVSALGSEVEGAIFKLDAKTGRILKTWTGFGEGLTGIAVADDGTLYASELLHNAPAGDGPPPKGFDPATVGRIVKVAADGTKSYAAVPMPAGLAWHNGSLYSTAWAIAGLVGIKSAGQVVQVSPTAFVAAAAN